MKELIAQLFAARDCAHKLHLKTRSFAQHIALGDLYEGLVPLADALAEAYQGKYGVMDISTSGPIMSFDCVNPVTFIGQLAAWAESAKGQFSPTDTNLLNDWDTVLSLIYSTKYKLENLA
jgi:hypothetical protein